MSCDPDLDTLISEIEWLVKNHSQCMPEFHDRLKPCEDECHTMKITLDIFIKLHQMLHNYIGLVNFRGPKSRDLCCLKIPLNEALDVAVRAMISTMKSSANKQPSSTPVYHNCTKNSESIRYRSTNNLINKCDLDKFPEIEKVDKKLLRLKIMTVENVEDVEGYIKDVLHDITKLPLTSMTSRLEILSSVVRNTKNKLISCGRPIRAESNMMRTQVNSISKIIGDFILEYGEMKSKIYPCRKICRFCNNVICPLDRQRHIYCCENAKHLNFIWKEWIQQNSLKGVAKWDESTIMTIVDSFKDTPIEGSKCVPGGPCSTFCRTAAGQRDSKPAGQDAEDEKKIKRRGDTKDSNKQENIISSDFSQGGSQGVDNRPQNRGLQDREARSKIGRLKTGEKRNSQDSGKESRFRASQKQDKGKEPERRGRGTNSHSSNIQSVGEGDVRKNFHMDKTSRKKGLKKDAGEVDLNDQGDNLQVDGRKKGTRSGRGDIADPKKIEDDSHLGNKGRGKSNRIKKGEFFDHSAGDQKIGNRNEPSGVESSKKGREAKNPEKDENDGRGTDKVTSPGKGIINPFNKLSNKNGAIEPGGFEIERLGNNDAGISPGTKTRENYGEADGKWSSVEGREVKSGNGTREDSENIIQYRLSNELFIKLGWTLLPKDTIMRRVVQFQALMAKPHLNWFTNSRIYGRQYYPDEKTIFMNFLGDGSGHVYYPNGQTAIAAQISKKETHELYKVYALGGRDVMGVVRLPWLMGVFDSMGNGVVYDEDCNVRLTYNQNGGVYVDNPAKVPFSWGWNNFQTFPIDEAVYEEPLADQLTPKLLPSREVKSSSSKASKQSKSPKVTNSGKLNEDQAASGDQIFKPVESVMVIPRKVITPLKPICLRMNKYLSLRIMDRKNINLQFFSGPKCVRIELGTEINPNVQINSELVDRDEWTAKMTKSRFHVDMNKSKLNTLSPDNSLLEIAEEFQHAKNEANSRQLMIAKYKPHLISSS